MLINISIIRLENNLTNYSDDYIYVEILRIFLAKPHLAKFVQKEGTHSRPGHISLKSSSKFLQNFNDELNFFLKFAKSF